MADIQSIISFVSENTVPVKLGRRCVDGRYLKNGEDSGMIARAGGDFGYVLILMSLNKKLNLGLTPEECFDAIYNYVTKDGGLFYMHTDHHADPEGGPEESSENGEVHEGPIIGCGHLAKPTNPELAPGYSVDPDEVVSVIEYARDRIEQGDPIKMVNLSGEHQEQATLVVTGVEKTIDPFNQDQFFVYDKTRDFAYIDQMLIALNIEGVTTENFKEVSDEQTQATLHNLAKGQKIFTVDVDGNQPVVEEAGVVS